MKKKINWKKELMDFSFLAPSLILFLFIILVPLVRGVPVYIYELGRSDAEAELRRTEKLYHCNS